MNLPANGKTGLIVAGLVLSSLSFMTGWIAKREGESEVRGADHQSILSLESWRKEHTETTTTPGMERLRKAEIELANLEARLTAFERQIGELTALKVEVSDMRRDVSEIRITLRDFRGGRP